MKQIRVPDERHITFEFWPFAFWVLVWLAITFVALFVFADPRARIPHVYDPWAPWPEPANGAE